MAESSEQFVPDIAHVEKAMREHDEHMAEEALHHEHDAPPPPSERPAPPDPARQS